MEKEMSSFKEKKIELNNNFSLIDKLNIMVDHFREHYDVEVCFCEIIGKRWSFIAGDANSHLPQRRIQMTENLGLIIDDSNLSESQIDKLVDVIESALSDTRDDFSD